MNKPKRTKPGRPRLGKARRVFIGTNVTPESAQTFRAYAKEYKSLGAAMDALIDRIK